MDHTSGTPAVNLIWEKVILGGGGVIPEVGAIDTKGWAVLLNVTTEVINGYIKDNNIPHKRFASLNWCTPVDFWSSIPFQNEPEPPKKGKR